MKRPPRSAVTAVVSRHWVDWQVGAPGWAVVTWLRPDVEAPEPAVPRHSSCRR